jgi:S1/P1 Nuclease
MVIEAVTMSLTTVARGFAVDGLPRPFRAAGTGLVTVSAVASLVAPVRGSRNRCTEVAGRPPRACAEGKHLLRGCASFAASRRTRMGGARRIAFAACVCAMAAGPAASYGPSGHAVTGAIAERMLGAHAAAMTERIAAKPLAVAALWADCAKDVPTGLAPSAAVRTRRTDTGCRAFASADDQAALADFVRRNTVGCRTHETVSTACHKDYHYTDVPLGRTAYRHGAAGTRPNDLVAAAEVCIAVLRGRPALPPFVLRDQQTAFLLLAHLVGDLHQPLHVGALHLDASGRKVDPGDYLDTEPSTATRGGNVISIGRDNLHALWDAGPRGMTATGVDSAVVAAATRVPKTPGDPAAWPALWATETLAVARLAVDGLAFSADPAGPGRWTARATDPDAYRAAREEIQRRQLLRAGARLAQLLNALWP